MFFRILNDLRQADCSGIRIRKISIMQACTKYLLASRIVKISSGYSKTLIPRTRRQQSTKIRKKPFIIFHRIICFYAFSMVCILGRKKIKLSELNWKMYAIKKKLERAAWWLFLFINKSPLRLNIVWDYLLTNSLI